MSKASTKSSVKDIKAKSFLINQRKINFFDEGRGFPIVLLHGWLVCKDSFIPIAKLLSKKYRVIAPDLPGHGDSEILNKKHTLEAYLEFLNLFTRQLRIKRYHLIGSSLGGTLALMHALKSNRKVAKIIVQAPVFHWQQLPSKLTKLNCPSLKGIIKLLAQFKIVQKLYYCSLRQYVLQERVPRIKKHTSKNHWQKIKPIIDTIMSKFDSNEASFKTSTEFGLSVLDLNLTENLKRLNKKTLIIWGDHDITLNKKWGIKLSQIMPHAQYLEIKNATHDLLIEKYPEVVCEVIKFLN